jgi:hypothetical protein
MLRGVGDRMVNKYSMFNYYVTLYYNILYYIFTLSLNY